MPGERELVTVGRVGRAHGVRGDVSVEVWTDEPERRLAPGTCVLLSAGAAERRLRIEESRPHSGRWLVHFAGITDRASAQALCGAGIQVEVDSLERAAEPDEFFDRHLIGMAAQHADGSEIGVVSAVLHLPGQDVLEIRDANGRELLVPFVTQIVPVVDLDARRLVIDAPPGLIEPD